ncbi:30S ribosomal protein S9 [Candidatus Kaiserbacteria bacterium RIFCSPHIGHO2_01_FULL_50_13]|uniref:30S ribosomal protein S9 n=1 Tax=Candidatus Kaiserbacteria bacterium RIFCSPLOWO2_01_FULL_50_24 TaxID=1798507 RepID=A0A1F6EMS3_9BACT|nr:MAG: 30S ribosomal protein S9 [Candidatus Kaiserbacteria bacterium RIFCSPHIGHO2_01_FULL_50_13]OGG74948.1 MAG: 30S ribosomal protein S9 [Candidatus Kaiserbacteria bacterium RIFCSPLOWO2_01_FULL_50_24]OGG81750.1 MAG: 30S ribosomal protein S9 [Candidatus Kaiserbacteria bacterium RIFCSPLOWO2_02_FULL_51_13]
MVKEHTYTEGIGRRKTASARVRIEKAKNASLIVNNKKADEYFPLAAMVKTAYAPLSSLNAHYAVSAHVSGGGHKAQAEAVRMGIARAIVKVDGEQRKQLKVLGFLKRDPRAKERKKFGLKAARRAPQWSKR